MTPEPVVRRIGATELLCARTASYGSVPLYDGPLLYGAAVRPYDAGTRGTELQLCDCRDDSEMCVYVRTTLPCALCESTTISVKI